ncbi:MAG TPA: SigB/SigF/SigG family RNA polymerase sigma factor [Solirubrobacteraceae bacterium]|jgi:RNA polymerase sigma-B factor|nr:SigB/SigF/SigG family RNA polymerase sigma factor [Solirubrobacteraceae bacterium]
MTAVATSDASLDLHSLTDEALFRRLRQTDEHAARDELFARYASLSRTMARRYTRSSEPIEDLQQVASLGLLKAIDRFDPERGIRFVSYATPTMLGELRRHFRDTTWAVHVPRGMQERALQVEHATAELTTRSGRSPGVDQIAQYTEMSIEDVLEGLQAARGYDTLSVDAPRRGTDGETEPLAESVGDVDDGFELVDAALTVRAGLSILAPREREILRLRFNEDLTQTEIADRVGLSQMQISRLLRRSLQQLNEFAEAAEARV